jgi:hypothetical protein
MARRGRDRRGHLQRAGARRHRWGAGHAPCLADDAAGALAALSDAPESDSYSAAVGEVGDHARGDAFAPKILALARGFAGAQLPDFAKASFAELYAWSLAQSPAE